MSDSITIAGIVKFINQMGATSILKVETTDGTIETLCFRQSALGESRYADAKRIGLGDTLKADTILSTYPWRMPGPVYEVVTYSCSSSSSGRTVAL